MIPLLPEDTFKFSCSKNVPCFNECCRDLNQFLTPYDILRLKNHLKISSGVFLERYTAQHIGPETGLPVVTFKTDPASGLECPFVTPSGCSVYEDRPSSCRTYPLARLASRSRETGKITEQYVLLKESHCLGFEQEQTWTVREWVKNQDIEIYNEMNDLLMEVISLKNRLHPAPLDIKARHFFHMACYDLDAFRSQLDNFNLDADTLEAAKKDDTELLKLGMQWIKKTLF
ncbi:Putative zinc- or iron-chelating domain-containing protein [Desulfonema magnum]|uniref:Zinc- or iron-chelating domain-containing protein n=2 Tax=Desulfonema magnum TaxID=45655 RepID=A0A975BQN7_9BACT|nr:Putative zinc- or iron-chelating domain-containing protein [Desulfonema magnum]